MNGVDYTKQLAKDREYFQDAVQKTKAAADKRISDTNERSDHVTSKQRENFIEDKADLETSYQKNLNHLKEKTSSSLENNSSQHHEDMVKERESFTKQSLSKSKDFDRRLNDIKSSYQKAFESEQDVHQDLTKTQKSKYDRNVKDISEKTNEQMKGYQDSATGTGAQLKEQYNQERQQLVRAHQDHTTEVQKDSAKKRADLKERISSDYLKSKQVQDADAAHQQEYVQDRMTSMQNKYEDRSQSMAQDYSQRSDNLAQTQQLDTTKTNKQHQDKLMDVRRDFNKQMRLVELDKRRRDNGSGEFSEVMNRQQGLKDQTIHDAREKQLKGQLAQTQRNFQDKSNSDRDAYSDSMKAEGSEATARLDRKLNVANADKIVSVSKEREKAEAQLANRAHQNQLDKQSYEQQLMLEKNNATDRLTKLKENFNSSMKVLEEKHQTSIEDVTKVANQDKSAFVKNVQENRTAEIFEMKREFGKMMDSTVQDYEQRLANYQRENENLKMTMDQKVQGVLDMTQKQLESQKVLFEARHNADIKGQQLATDQRENLLKGNLTQMNVNFQKKMDKMQIESDMKLKLLTNDYENKLKELKASTTKDLAQKDMTQQIELERLKSTYQQEKAQMISGFDNQIQEMKKSQQNQLDQMKEYKGLA